jgi:hypothetical protein
MVEDFSSILRICRLLVGTSIEHGCNTIVSIGCFMTYIDAMNSALFALPFVVALVFAALKFHQEMR